MISLLIETSTERGIVALFREEELLHLVELPFGYQNSKHLLPTLQEAFSVTGLKVQDVQLIAVGIGPGSYTGIRVGAMTAKAIAYALQVPLVGVASLEGFIPQKESSYAAIIDAKIGGVYVQTGKSGPALYQIEEAIALLKDAKVLVTPCAQHLQSKMPGPWQWIERYPDPHQLMKIAHAKYKAGDFSRDYALDLLYLRKTQAEIEKQKP